MVTRQLKTYSQPWCAPTVSRCVQQDRWPHGELRSNSPGRVLSSRHQAIEYYINCARLVGCAGHTTASPDPTQGGTVGHKGKEGCAKGCFTRSGSYEPEQRSFLVPNRCRSGR